MKILRIAGLYVTGLAIGLLYVLAWVSCLWLAIVAWELLTFAFSRFHL